LRIELAVSSSGLGQVVLSHQTGVRSPVPLGFSIGSYSLAADVFLSPQFSITTAHDKKKIGRLAAPDLIDII
jgi:hypothetical protein